MNALWPVWEHGERDGGTAAEHVPSRPELVILMTDGREGSDKRCGGKDEQSGSPRCISHVLCVTIETTIDS